MTQKIAQMLTNFGKIPILLIPMFPVPSTRGRDIEAEAREDKSSVIGSNFAASKPDWTRDLSLARFR